MPPNAVRWRKLKRPATAFEMEAWTARCCGFRLRVAKQWDGRWHACNLDESQFFFRGRLPTLEAAQAFAEQWAREHKR